jgi:hypothetical protein
MSPKHILGMLSKSDEADRHLVLGTLADVAPHNLALAGKLVLIEP